MPTENLSVRIENYRDNEVLFHAALDLKRHEITQKTLMSSRVGPCGGRPAGQGRELDMWLAELFLGPDYSVRGTDVG